MKAKLTAGSEIEFVTADEIRQLMQEFASGWLRSPQTARPVGGIPLDSSGNSAEKNEGIFMIPPGYSFRLHRAGFFPDGSTYGAPFTSNTGYLEILRGGAVQDGIGFVSPGLPAVWSAGTADGIDYTNGEKVAFHVVGGPASVSLNIRLQGTLEPIVRQ